MSNKELIEAYLKNGGNVKRFELNQSAFSEGGQGKAKTGYKWGWGTGKVQG